MNNKQPQLETIPIRQPDGSFAMVKVSDSQVNSSKNKQPTKKSLHTDMTDAGSSAGVVKQNLSKPSTQSQSKIATQNFVKSTDKPVQNSIVDRQDGSVQNKNTTKSQDGVNWQASVDRVMDNISIKLFDDNAHNRLRSIILSRLRDVRDLVVVREYLTKGRDEGGLGLSDEDASSIIVDIENEYKHIHKNNNINSDIKKVDTSVVEDLYKPQAKLDALVESDIPYVETDVYKNAIADYLGTVSKPMPQTEPKEIQDLSGNIKNQKSPTAKISDTSSDFPKMQSLADDESKVDTVKEQVIDKKLKLESSFVPQPKVELKKTPEPSISFNAELATDNTPSIRKEVVRPTSATKSKPTMKDVISKKRLMGPIDELSSMRLIDFRRLGNSTEERLQKVKEHIEEMEDISFTKKVEAIKAWRSNPIYQMYLQLGSQSLMGSQTVEDVIKAKEEAGEETLSKEEFEQLTDFNKKLRY